MHKNANKEPITTSPFVIGGLTSGALGGSL